MILRGEGGSIRRNTCDSAVSPSRVRTRGEARDWTQDSATRG